MQTKKIINIGIVAHVDAGKTTLTEQLLYRAGELRCKGSVDDGTAQTDWLPVERERGISVRLSSAGLMHGGCRINIIDTPGHADFSGEVERGLSVLDCALLMISAVEGIQTQTELLLEALRETGTPTILLMNKIDRAGSDCNRWMKEIQGKYAPIIAFDRVMREGEKDCAVLRRDYTDLAFLEDCVLALAETNPELLEGYLSGRPLDEAALDEGLRDAIAGGRLFPALCSSTLLGVGVDDLLDFIIRYVKPAGGTKDDELSGVVYKVEHDRTMGKIAHVRLFGGCVKNRDSILIPSSGRIQKVTQVRRAFGGRFTDIGEVYAGDIAALCGLSDIKVGDYIGKRSSWKEYHLATPLLRVQVLPQKGEDLSPLITGLRELSDEDPLLDMEYIPEEREIDIRITGTVQLEIIAALLKERYGLEVNFSPPSVIYKETPLKAGEGYEAYTMPKPCWAIVKLLIEPGVPGSGLEFRSTVSDNDIFLRYQNHVETSVKESLKQGNYGWEVTDLRVTLVGGSHHTVHTHPLDFFLATPIAMRRGLLDAGTALLEPMLAMTISAGEEFLGTVIGDILRMRGEFESPVVKEGSFRLRAKVPVATSLEYPIRLGILTSGRAVVGTRFAGYQPCPPELGAVAKRRGVDPLDRSKWILARRNAM